jgi:type IV pilus assembly protein PilW
MGRDALCRVRWTRQTRRQAMGELEKTEKDHMNRKRNRGREQGFTIMELLVVILISSVVMAGIYSVYSSQQKSFIIQQDVAEMQQNLRTAMYFMVRDIRLAGCNPTGKADAGIKTAEENTISVAMDTRGKDPDSSPDGTTTNDDESVTYSISGNDLMRNTGGGPEAVASNIDDLKFVYLDGDGHVLASPVTGGNLAKIRSVQLTVTAKTDDGVRRRVFATNIRCRNLGLL